MRRMPFQQFRSDAAQNALSGQALLYPGEDHLGVRQTEIIDAGIPADVVEFFPRHFRANVGAKKFKIGRSKIAFCKMNSAAVIVYRNNPRGPARIEMVGVKAISATQVQHAASLLHTQKAERTAIPRCGIAAGMPAILIDEMIKPAWLTSSGTPLEQELN